MNVNNDATAACAEYRGQNSFNAKVKTFTVFVNGVGVTGNEQVWNKGSPDFHVDSFLAGL